MNLYRIKFFTKLAILLTAMLIVGGTMVYNNNLASKLATEELKKVDLYAKAQKELNKPKGEPDFFNLYNPIIQENNTIPIVITDENGQIQIDNLEDFHGQLDAEHKQEHLQQMKESFTPIQINVTDDIKQYLYYQESDLLHQLRMYPYIQLFTMGVFLLVSYAAFSNARRSEQDRVWVGMARETAHQLGTPLSSLTAWIDNLKELEDENLYPILNEMEKDTDRLNLITDRFSKIGSKPKLKEHNLIEYLELTYTYVNRRASKRVTFSNNFALYPQLNMYFSPPLLDWVIENLLKNAIDALKNQSEGNISVEVTDMGEKVQIDVVDNGCGIPLTRKNDVFKPGYSNKERGWGLGLSLSKRIVVEYHKGEIFVHKSVVGKGSTFRVLLPKKPIIS